MSSDYWPVISQESLDKELFGSKTLLESPVTYPPTPESMHTPGTEESSYNYVNPDHWKNSNDHQMIIDQSSASSTSGESSVELPIEKSHNSKHQPANENECDSKPTRKRTKFTNQQLMAMESEFRKNKNLCRPGREELACLLGLNKQQVKVWFQNRRVKEKKIELNKEAEKVKNVSCNATTECEKKDMVMTNQEKQQVITNTVPAPVNSYIQNHPSLNNYSSNAGYHQQPQVWNVQNGVNYGMVQNQNHCHSSGNERHFVNNYINYPDCAYNNLQNNYGHYNNYGGYNIQNESANIVQVDERTHNHISYGSIQNEQNYHYNGYGPIQSNTSHYSNTNIQPNSNIWW